MRKFVVLTICFLAAFSIQTKANPSEPKDVPTTDSTHIERIITQDIVSYRLFPTASVRIFIKLNTRNGCMWQVRLNSKSNDSFETPVNSSPFVSEKNEVNGRFTLYSTESILNFILLDQIDGRMWQVQWPADTKKLNIVQIN